MDRGIANVARRKPAGGFCFIEARALLAAWLAYRRGIVRRLDLRVWFACFELVARRCGARTGRIPRYGIPELHTLVGGAGGKHLRASVKRLEQAGLLSWSDSCIRPLTPIDNPQLGSMLAMVANHRRKVPVPRRTLRFLSGGPSRAVMAVVLGHLLRCVYYRNGRCETSGTCKASWVAEVFGVHLRNVKAARQCLARMCWLELERTPQNRMNRFGVSVRVNFDWVGTPKMLVPQSPPPRPAAVTKSPPLYKDRKLSSRSGNQKPATRAGDGVQTRPADVTNPNLRRIASEDLTDTHRLLRLFTQAAAEGLVADGESGRLRFVAAAEHAKRIGKTNPCGLFAAIVRRKLWRFIGLVDEDAARKRLQIRTLADTRPRAQGKDLGTGCRIGRPVLARDILLTLTGGALPSTGGTSLASQGALYSSAAGSSCLSSVTLNAHLTSSRWALAPGKPGHQPG